MADVSARLQEVLKTEAMDNEITIRRITNLEKLQTSIQEWF
jgi:hypothetical protein